MPRFKLQISVLVAMLLWLGAAGQPGGGRQSDRQQPYALYIQSADRDAAFIAGLGIPENFRSRNECVLFISRLPAWLQGKGYINASVDSVQYDTSFARVVLYTGSQYEWLALDTKSIDPAILAAAGWNGKRSLADAMYPGRIQQWQENVLAYMENNGHPFARVYLDSAQIIDGKISAKLKLDPGPLYTIDSIRVFGPARISNQFLQQYLELPDGSLFSREKVQRISKRLGQLQYVEEESPPALVWLGTGAVLELHLKPRKSSQVNVLIGLLPANDQLPSGKLLVTGEANLDLKNALGAGETIGLNWQQLQVQSPRLYLLYQHPYLFHSPVGLDLAFNMFRRDSIFLNVNFQLGARYIFGAGRSGSLFLQRFQTIVNGVNTDYVLQNYRLPDEAAVSTVNLGIDYEYNTTDYRLNPSRGHELRMTTAAGTKKIRRAAEVLELKDPGNPSFNFASLYDSIKLKTWQLSLRATAANYFPLGSQGRSVLKTALNGGWLQSSTLFTNELFRIGGYKLLRGFDEESQYLSQFLIATAEYRYRVARDSYFYFFTDGGWGKNGSRNAGRNYTYFGTGVGLAFSTGAGIFNLAWAVGKRSDLELNFRQSKIHFGFAGYF